jgi:6-pyruvoyltetrahydropterin/6-carboxytetrahydropterin synthase
MVHLCRRVRFSAAHRYFLPHFSDEENIRLFGTSAGPSGHGHDYLCEVTVSGETDPETGIVLNLVDLKRLLEECVVEPLDREFLTAMHPFCRGQVPTGENLVRLIWRVLEPSLVGAQLNRVRLEESDDLRVECLRKDNDLMVFLTRTYEFSAAHRLHSPHLTDERNQEIFGKCNNPYGHGHNYRVDVTVQGPVDERTGMMVDLAYLDRVVNEEIVARYDHKNLNLDTEEFRELNPTSENLVKVVWRRLAPRLKSPLLYRVTVHETDRNVFSYYGEGE